MCLNAHRITGQSHASLSCQSLERSHYGALSFITGCREEAASLLCVLVTPMQAQQHKSPQAQLENLMDSKLMAM